MKIFFLIGFMGSGKTHWGKIWSSALNIPFVDLDDAIETKEGMAINSIFAEKGETYFRKIETAVLHEIANGTGDVLISCGGGTPCFNDNMEWMNAVGTTIYLKSSPATLALRLQKEKGKRPLIKDVEENNLESVIAEKLSQREFYYNQATVTLPEENINDQSLISLYQNNTNA